ncbi:hypothetical protein ETU08_07680 [Apibacter muscae]|uniref:hypothetical protein n=1 Tax=Apibacter muscae TaxID=2509004 RepID=UPI0011AC50EB|nr:hypothetical protein [Apibacter muscae]TWP29372.1 hypothetical protein ETU08_07680 [Apibacter muscae]
MKTNKINKNNLRLSEEAPSLFSDDDPATGLLIYYLGEDKEELFTGELYEIFQEHIVSEYEVKNGKKEGIQIDYFRNGSKDSINENSQNMQFGVYKEFDEHEKLKVVSVIWFNLNIKSIEFSENTITITEKKIDKKYIIPKRIESLLNLSNEELINYSFPPMVNGGFTEEDKRNVTARAFYFQNKTIYIYENNTLTKVISTINSESTFYGWKIEKEIKDGIINKILLESEEETLREVLWNGGKLSKDDRIIPEEELPTNIIQLLNLSPEKLLSFPFEATELEQNEFLNKNIIL